MMAWALLILAGIEEVIATIAINIWMVSKRKDHCSL